MKRKIIQLAGKTSVISLPSKWVRECNIKKGYELEVIEQGKELLIKTETFKTNEKISMDIADFNEMTLRYSLSALHKTGYDEIILFYSNQKQVEIIQDMVKNLLLGFIIIEQNSKKLILKSITLDVEEEFDPTLRRAFLVSISLADSSLGILENNPSDLKSLIHLEKTNNQLTSFCMRLINKGDYKSKKNIQFISTIVWSLEKISDQYKYICIELKNNQEKINKEIFNIYKEVNNFFRLYYELFYKFEILKFNEVSDKRFEIIKMMNNISIKNKSESRLLNLLNAILSKTADLSSSIFGLRHYDLKECKINEKPLS